VTCTGQVQQVLHIDAVQLLPGVSVPDDGSIVVVVVIVLSWYEVSPEIERRRHSLHEIDTAVTILVGGAEPVPSEDDDINEPVGAEDDVPV
jgi:hypothetical protein